MSDDKLDVLAKAMRLMKTPTEANIKKARALIDEAGDLESRMIADLFDSFPSIP